ncbi:hypothetical protein ONZ43_g3967 [Nemania bipapillata]|uniref:Uncharacterized protein n=1 Tax=Nemania bipapillata TaxID=110536 RepID=A0ACC2ITS2_9PEZI|nr:hypothetical protein ONZ43_g3967 [Nemania bipapillata]
MRATLSTIALCAISASAATLPAAAEIEARQATSNTWYLVGFEPNCGSSFGCNADYAIFGPENAVPGAPAFALRTLLEVL